MIISPRAKEVIDIRRKDGNRFIPIDEVFLYLRAGMGNLYRKILYWKRGEDSTTPPPPNWRSFAIVPEMTAAVTRGFGVHSTAMNAWQAFDRKIQTTGQFTLDTMVSFPEVRLVKGFAFRFEYAWNNNVWLAIEGKNQNGSWIRLHTSRSDLINYGRYGAVTTPMPCTAVRVRTDSLHLMQSFQVFEVEPLVPMTMTSNTSAGVRLVSEPQNHNLYQCFRQQVSPYTHGTIEWYRNSGEWRSNRGLPSTQRQNRFLIHFDKPQEVRGFSIGGLSWHEASNCYANCLLIEGRQTESDAWRSLIEIEYDPAERRTRYYDFSAERLIRQLRITVQDVTHGNNPSNNTSLYLPPMQVYGIGGEGDSDDGYGFGYEGFGYEGFGY